MRKVWAGAFAVAALVFCGVMVSRYLRETAPTSRAITRRATSTRPSTTRSPASRAAHEDVIRIPRGSVSLAPGGRFALAFANASTRVSDDVHVSKGGWQLLDLAAGGKAIASAERDFIAMHSAVLTPDGKRAVIRGSDFTPAPDGSIPDVFHRPHYMATWNTNPARELCRIGGDAIEGIAMTDDGRFVFSVDNEEFRKPSGGRVLRLRDASSGRVIREQRQEIGRPFSVAISPDAKVAITGGWERDETVRVWSLPEIKLQHTLLGHHAIVSAVALSDDGRRGFSADAQSLCVWDLPAGRLIRQFHFDGGWVRAMALADDQQWLATSHDHVRDSPSGGSTQLWNVRSGATTRAASSAPREFGLAFARDKLYTASSSQISIRPLDAMEKLAVAGDASPSSQPSSSLVWKIDRPPAIRDGKIHLLAWEGNQTILCGLVENDGEYLVRRDATAGQQLARVSCDALTSFPHPVALSPDHRYVLSAGHGEDRMQVEVWNATTGANYLTWDGPVTSLNAVSISLDGKIVAAGGGTWDESRPKLDKYLCTDVELWDFKTGNTIATIPGNGREVRALAWSPDSKRLLVGSDAPIDNYVGIGHKHPPEYKMPALRLWDVGAGSEIAAYVGLDEVRTLAFTPDGAQVVVECGGSLYLFDAAKLRLVRRVGSPGMTDQIAISADGKRILTAGRDSNVRLFDLATGKQLACFEDHQWDVRCVAFSPDGKRAVSGDEGGTICLWKLP